VFICAWVITRAFTSALCSRFTAAPWAPRWRFTPGTVTPLNGLAEGRIFNRAALRALLGERFLDPAVVACVSLAMCLLLGWCEWTL
jgi:hypothetical protein